MQCGGEGEPYKAPKVSSEAWMPPGVIAEYGPEPSAAPPSPPHPHSLSFSPNHPAPKCRMRGRFARNRLASPAWTLGHTVAGRLSRMLFWGDG
jgi:hypothetical protein